MEKYVVDIKTFLLAKRLLWLGHRDKQKFFEEIGKIDFPILFFCYNYFTAYGRRYYGPPDNWGIDFSFMVTTLRDQVGKNFNTNRNLAELILIADLTPLDPLDYGAQRNNIRQQLKTLEDYVLFYTTENNEGGQASLLREMERIFCTRADFKTWLGLFDDNYDYRLSNIALATMLQMKGSLTDPEKMELEKRITKDLFPRIKTEEETE